MADKTGIQWTDATWNPTAGCTIVSPGCTNCYAMKMAARLERMGGKGGAKYAGLTQPSKAGPVWNGTVRLDKAALDQPLRWPRPRRIFVNSMSDLFHESLPDAAIDRVFAVMALAPQHTFQVLTKRAERMRRYCNDEQTPFRVARAIDALGSETGPEEVRPIAGYPGYLASSHGFIYSEKRGARRKMKGDAGDQGHLRVQLHRDGKEDRRGDRPLVHRIILETFVGPAPAPDIQGRHTDGDPGNNAISNLRWGDQEANWDDSKRHGTHRRYSKLTPSQAAEIRRRHEAGETAASLGREFGISDTQARNIGTGKQWAISSPIEWPLVNCWLGVSVEDQARADERIPHLLATPAAVRFLSCEPLLGEVDLFKVRQREHGHIDALRGGLVIFNEDRTISDIPPIPRINWVIAGGESGHNARPMHPDWARSLRDQCGAAGVPFFFKQWGEFLPFGQSLPGCGKVHGATAVNPGRMKLHYGGTPKQAPKCAFADRGVDVASMTDGRLTFGVGKRAAGRLLDGVEHNAFPAMS